MTEEALRIDIDRVLAPISGSKEAGEDIRNRNIFTSIRSLRVTEDAQGIIGSAALLPGEARVADWRKVLELCEATLSHRSKDLRIAVWLADAAVRVGGLTGLMDGLRVLAGLHERYWTSMFPLLEDYDLEERAGWIEQCDDLLATAIGGVRIADAGPEYSRSFDDWRRSKVLQEKSSLLKEDDHANEMKKEAEALQQAISIAIARTPEVFYRTLQTLIVDCLYECDALKTVLIDRFSAEYVNAPASVARVATPKFLNTRTTLQECQTLVVQFLPLDPARMLSRRQCQRRRRRAQCRMRPIHGECHTIHQKTGLRRLASSRASPNFSRGRNLTARSHTSSRGPRDGVTCH